MTIAAGSVVARRARRLLFLAWLAQLAVILAWWWRAAGWPPGASELLSLLPVLPLAAILPSILRGSRAATAGATLLLTPYIGWGVTETVANAQARPFAVALVLTAVCCFALSIYWLRVLRDSRIPD